MRCLICAGGTGGGVYPALTTWQALKAELGDSLVTLWVGGEGGMEADLVARAGLPFVAIPAAGVHGVGLRVLPGNLLCLGRGFFQAIRILKRFRPDVLFFTGGFVAVPVALAGLRLPTVLFVPDIQPGLALKTLAWLSNRIAITVEDSRRYLPTLLRKRAEVTGYPVRPELQSWTKEAGFQELGLVPGMPVLLVSGGSKGSRSINRAVLQALPELLPKIQIIHLTGTLDWPELQKELAKLNENPALRPWLERYHPRAYLHDMGAALAAADLVISRAGASSLGEYPHFGLPSVLVPYPYAWIYQKVNARWMEKSGAAVVLEDAELPIRMVSMLNELFDNPERLEAMRQAARKLELPDSAQLIARLLIQEADRHHLRR